MGLRQEGVGKDPTSPYGSNRLVVPPDRICLYSHGHCLAFRKGSWTLTSQVSEKISKVERSDSMIRTPQRLPTFRARSTQYAVLEKDAKH